MSWTHEYMSIPFLDVGRTRQGADCYGVPLIIYDERLSIKLPLRTGYTSTEPHKSLEEYVAEGKDIWVEIPQGQEREYDIVLLRFMNLPIHMGIITDIPKHMLHTCEGQGVTVENYKKGKWTAPGKIVGFYRHIELCKT